MRQSKLFTKTRKEGPKDEISINSNLLIRAGFIQKEMSGVYDLLPLGNIVISRIREIIKKHMDDLGGQEISMTSLQDKSVWEKSGRWSDEAVDNWFKTELKSGGEVGLGFTHEEPITRMLKDHVNSYKDLPVYVYQFQTKFRNELRAKSGILRSREFLMKDLYSFSLNEKDHNEFYEKVSSAYENIFNEVGIGDKVYKTFASGGSFSKFSHEFQMVTDAGEDIIYVDENKKIAINQEVLNEETLNELGLDKGKLTEKKSVEVGNIFSLGTKYAEALGLLVDDEKGKKNPAVMGSYGIGLGRLMGAVVEANSNEKGIIWPKNVTPFHVHLLCLSKDEELKKMADELYLTIKQHGFTVLYDDRDVSAGSALNDSDLIGIPLRLVIGSKTHEDGMIEMLDRISNQETRISFADCSTAGPIQEYYDNAI